MKILRFRTFSNLFEKIGQKVFGNIDKGSDFWREKIKNETDPRRRAKFQEQLNYALEEEAKSDPKKAQEFFKIKEKAEREAREKAAQAREGFVKAEKKRVYEDFIKPMNKDLRNQSRLKRGIRKGEFLFNNAKFIVPASIVVGIGAYNSKKNREKWEKKKSKEAKSFSKKEEYLKGEETDYQKKRRKYGTVSILGSGIITGAGAGALTTADYVDKRITDVADRAYDEGVNFYRNYVNNVRHPHVDEVISKPWDHFKGVNEKTVKRLRKVGNKKIIKNGIIGAGVGAVLGGTSAYAYNNSTKTRNERLNSSRRRKKKSE